MLKEFLMVFFIIIFHEIGHLLMAKYFKWNFDKICIYPFGGCTKFDEKINRPLHEEFLILINGPLFQIILFFIVTILLDQGLITYRNYIIFNNYSLTLLVFNLLPIYPLDGGRILNIIMNYFLPYKKGNLYIIFISSLTLIIILFCYKNLNFLLMSLLLFFEIFLYFKRQNFLYNKMLLERYMYSFPFKKFKVVKNKDSLYKDRNHVIYYENKYITEKEYLKKRFR